MGAFRDQWAHRIGPAIRPPYTQQQRSGALAFAIIVVIAILFSR